MVSVTIKSAIATNRLSDKKEEKEIQPKAEGSADENGIGGEEQDLHAKEDHDT